MQALAGVDLSLLESFDATMSQVRPSMRQLRHHAVCAATIACPLPFLLRAIQCPLAAALVSARVAKLATVAGHATIRLSCPRCAAPCSCRAVVGRQVVINGAMTHLEAVVGPPGKGIYVPAFGDAGIIQPAQYVPSAPVGGDSESKAPDGRQLFLQSMKQQVITHGTRFRLRHKLTGLYLHSHDIKLPKGSKQQQVTCFGGRNSDDLFFLKSRHGQSERGMDGRPVANGSIVRLQHVNTKRNLHSHSLPSHVANGQHEVTCWQTNAGGDSNDNWKVECKGELEANTPFRLIHVETNHALHSHKLNFNFHATQQEVTCHPGRDDNDLWYIEPEVRPRLSPHVPDHLHLSCAVQRSCGRERGGGQPPYGWRLYPQPMNCLAPHPHRTDRRWA